MHVPKQIPLQLLHLHLLEVAGIQRKINWMILTHTILTKIISQFWMHIQNRKPTIGQFSAYFNESHVTYTRNVSQIWIHFWKDRWWLQCARHWILMQNWAGRMTHRALFIFIKCIVIIFCLVSMIFFNFVTLFFPNCDCAQRKNPQLRNCA
jgi:hypothetical protein